VFGIGLGMLVSPLFDFVLTSVTDAETGSASGVLNALQQLAGAVGVAGIGTIFFFALGRHGYVVAISRCLLVELTRLRTMRRWHSPSERWAVRPFGRKRPYLLHRQSGWADI